MWAQTDRQTDRHDDSRSSDGRESTPSAAGRVLGAGGADTERAAFESLHPDRYPDRTPSGRVAAWGGGRQAKLACLTVNRTRPRLRTQPGAPRPIHPPRVTSSHASWMHGGEAPQARARPQAGGQQGRHALRPAPASSPRATGNMPTPFPISKLQRRRRARDSSPKPPARSLAASFMTILRLVARQTRLPGATDNTRYGEGRASPRSFLTHQSRCQNLHRHPSRRCPNHPQRRQRAHAPYLIWGRVRCVYSERAVTVPSSRLSC